MTTYSVAAVLAFVVAVITTPVARVLAVRLGAVDVAGAIRRKLHARDVPRLGGLALIAGFYVPLIGLLFVESSVGRKFLHDPVLAYGMLGGGLAIGLLGFVDDVRGLSARRKLVVQAAVAVVVVALGFRIRVIDLPLLPAIDGALAYPISVLWIVGVTNAFNLIDGLDGLAAGVSLFGIVPIVVVGILQPNPVLALIAISLAASTLGFLLFNFHPARIFMGDSGSMFLGFVLALVTVQASAKGSLVVSLLAPLLALGLPIMDTLVAITRRTVLGQRIFAGDSDHIHHRLLRSGLSHRQTVLVMYAAAMALSVASTGILMWRSRALALAIIITCVTCAVLMRKVGYFRLRDLRASWTNASALRVRNRAMFADLDRLAKNLRKDASHVSAIEFARQLARLTGADGGRLTFANDASISLNGTVSTGTAVDFAIAVPGRESLGKLQLVWRDGQPDSGTLSVVEHGCVSLARVYVAQPPLAPDSM